MDSRRNRIRNLALLVKAVREGAEHPSDPEACRPTPAEVVVGEYEYEVPGLLAFAAYGKGEYNRAGGLSNSDVDLAAWADEQAHGDYELPDMLAAYPGLAGSGIKLTEQDERILDADYSD